MDDATRDELDRRIIANGFGNYVALSEWLSEQGYEIGKTAVGLRGQNLKRKLSAIRASTEAAKMIAQAAPDEADDRSNAIISMVQTDIFEALVSLQEAQEEEDHAKRIAILGEAAKHIATLTRASVARNRWAVEVRQKARAELLREQAEKLDGVAKSAGLTADTVEQLRREILGVAA
jgi:hypothetical protein